MTFLKFLKYQSAFFVELFLSGPFVLLFFLKNGQWFERLPHLEWYFQIIELTSLSVPVVILYALSMAWWRHPLFEDFLRHNIFSILIFVPLVMVWGDQEFTFGLAAVHLFSTFLNVAETRAPVLDLDKIGKEKWWTQMLENLSPTQLILLTFISIIFVGTILLALPISTAKGHALGFVDALFMSTSATCVTGLATLSVAQDLSFFGQMVILVLIQVGGLGIMTITSFTALFLGRKMDVRERVVMIDVLNAASFEDMLSTVKDIVKYTLVIEAWGGIILTIGFLWEGLEFSQAFYNGFFHSISAFCNAGLSLFDNSLENFSNSPLIHGTISVLVILGGLGFIVLKELKAKIGKPDLIRNLTLHTKVVLLVSLILTLGGAVVIFFSEYLHALDGRSTLEQIQIALFQSITTRTAGFDTISISSLQPHTIYFMTALMFVGASPGGTGGGIKTTTFAILIQSVRATIFARDRVEIFDRTIPLGQIVKVTALTLISVIVTLGAVFILMWAESGEQHFSFLPIFYEVVSAFGTVGLSMGITSQLTDLGKIILLTIMYIGRVGPLTLILGFGARGNRVKYHYPDGRIQIG